MVRDVEVYRIKEGEERGRGEREYRPKYFLFSSFKCFNN
jgi:hypothetical protein